MRAMLLSFGAAGICAAVLLVTALPPAGAATGPIPLNCDRACLEALVNQYLTALVARNPATLPLSKDVKYTENNQLLEVGDGFWKTVEGRGNYSHYFADPEAGQVAYMGTMREAGGLVLMSLRLRVELGRITEIESVFFKPGGGGPNNIAFMDTYQPEEFWFKSIPPAQRQTRAQLIAAADDYFTGLQKNDGKGNYNFTNDCKRLENGAYTAGAAPNPNLAPGAMDTNAMDCLSQFRLGYYFVVQKIHHRRYPVVDQERGVVWSHSIFDQGTVNKSVLSNGKQFEFKGFNRPSSILVTEAFLIENGNIRRVEMVGTSVPYHMNSPWGGLSGD